MKDSIFPPQQNDSQRLDVNPASNNKADTGIRSMAPPPFQLIASDEELESKEDDLPELSQ